jgi:hypothetical protein
MSFIVLFLLFLFFFTIGAVGGLVVGTELTVLSEQQKNMIPQQTCEGCECIVEDGVYCENCVDEDRLSTALKEKETEMRYVNAALRQRNMLNRPEKEELEKLKVEIGRMEKLMENMEEVSRGLRLRIDGIQRLKEKNEVLKESVERWEEINERERKLDKILSSTRV